MSGYDLTNALDRDDRRKHLDLIAAVVGRMGTSSAQAKGWSITLAGAAFGVAVLRDNNWPLIVLGIVGLVAFAKIDAHYLHVEKTYRDLHDAVVVENNVVPLSMDTANLPARSRNESYASWSIKWFYAPLIFAGVLLLIYSFVHSRSPEPQANITVNVPSQSPSTPSISPLPPPPPPSPRAVTPPTHSPNTTASPPVPDAQG
ncbi:MAG: hypothetical protein CL534_07915 [Ahrensia sp.]|nr:hypothetical protein [Ahrensia sp.]